MAIPHIGHGRVIKYGGNDAANSRDISMMPGDFKKMGDQNKDMSPVKFISGAGSKQGAAKMMQQSYEAPIRFNSGLRKASANGELDDNLKFKAAVDGAAKFLSGAGSKQGAAKMMQQSYGAPAPGPAKNKPCPPGENCDEEGFRYITQSRLDSNALDSNASGATSANALGGALNEVVVTGNKNNTSPSTEKKGKTAVGEVLQSVGNTISSLFKPKVGFKVTKFGKNKNKRQRTGV